VARVTTRCPFHELIRHEACLVLLVVRGVQRNKLALVATGPEPFAHASPIVTDKTISGRQDGAGGAVVLL
jgi:hypothetical protein